MFSSSPITAAVTLTLVSAAAVGAPRDLDADALDGITAGAQSVAQTSAAADGGSVVVADQSSIDLHVAREVEVQDAVQQNATALNIVNVASADVANAVNVSTAMGARVFGRQLNEIFQVEHSYGRVERISLAGPNLTRSYSTTSAFASASSSESTNARWLQSRSSRSVVDTYSTAVPAYYPLQDLTIRLETPSMPAVTVPAFDFDLTYSDEVGTYGIRGDLGPFTFDPPQFVLPAVSFEGDDLVVSGGHIDLPRLDLGTASITLCAVECGKVEADLPTIDGPLIELPGWTFEGANPFKDVRINAGNGIAAAGRGHITVDPSHVTLTSELSLDLPDLTTEFSFDVLGHTVDTGRFGVKIPPISASLTLVNEDIGPGYDAEFDGALCLSVQSSDCGTLEHSESSQFSSVDIRQTSASSSSSTYEETTSAGEQHVTPGATLSGAEAELIAMSEGRAQIEQSSVVELGSHAQRGMQALNAINATGAIIGNALNVGSQRTGAASAAGIAQTNVFSQYKTRPRGL